MKMTGETLCVDLGKYCPYTFSYSCDFYYEDSFIVCGFKIIF